VPCYRPLQCVSGGVKPNGKINVLFTGKTHTDDPLAFKIPCGKCLGCGLDRARQWSIRCVHESQMHEHSAFITLTYDQDHLPPGGSITPRDFQLFIKRLRKDIAPQKIRYFHCGEYGPKLGRPHYHALIFGYSFPDRELFKEQPFRWYRSKQLERLWPNGFSTVADVTSASASYVARYTLKKVYGVNAKSHYKGKHPEYITMSRRPGIGATWYDKFHTDIYPSGVFITPSGIKQSPPKFYDNRYGLTHPIDLARLKLARKARASTIKASFTHDGKTRKVSNSDSFRLPVREEVKRAQTQSLRRSYEDYK